MSWIEVNILLTYKIHSRIDLKKKKRLFLKESSCPFNHLNLMNDHLTEITRDFQNEVAAAGEKMVAAAGEVLNANQKYWLNVPNHFSDLLIPFWSSAGSLQDIGKSKQADAFDTAIDAMKAAQTYWLGVLTYVNDFMYPYWTAANAFSEREREKLVKTNPMESVLDYLELLQFNLNVAEKGIAGSLKGLHDYQLKKSEQSFRAWVNTLMDGTGPNLHEYSARQARLMDLLVYGYPQAIKDIERTYGFHFDDGGYIKTAETDRFILYRVLPRDKTIKTRETGKPIIILPPYVLGPNILAFLPDEQKSYTHAYAHQGIPTYIRVIKDIETTPAVQLMTGEDDALDTRYFCDVVKKAHGRAVTLNGFCQGGFMAVLDILSGELDGLVDALITCVAPMDGTRSAALVEYMQHLPPRFRDLGYALKILPNGNRVVDGKVMSWVYKLKSMEKEFSLVTLYRDLLNLEGQDGGEVRISSTAAAMNHWLLYDRNDLPEGITKLSFDSYTIPVDQDGTLPIRLFGRTLNFKGLRDKGIRWLLCYAEKDDLVDKAAATAPLEFVDAELCVFPKGHGAIATSWSHPDTECAIDKRFGGCRGPVRFQLDLESEGSETKAD
jgi:hypothetical protein